MKKLKHVHKYKRIYLRSTKVVKDQLTGKRSLIKGPATIVYKCMQPNCKTFKILELLDGEKSICWACGEEMTLSLSNLNKKYPVHNECKKSRPDKRKVS